MRVFGHYVLGSRVKLFFAEQAAAGVLFLAATASGGLGGAKALWTAVACVLGIQVGLYLSDLYQPREDFPVRRWLFGAGAGTLLATGAWWKWGVGEPGIFLVAIALALLVALLLRGLALSRPRRALVLGTGAKARAVAQLVRESSADCAVVGFVPDETSTDAGPSPLPILLGRSGELDLLSGRMEADLIVVATPGPLPEEPLCRARAAGIEVVSAAGFAARFARRLPPELLAPSELVYGEGFFAPRAFDAVQRAIDLATAALLLLFAAPALILAMLAVKLDSPGPVFYRQDRVGRRGRVFRLVKLRSMREDAEKGGAPVWAAAGDGRVTRVGRVLRRTRLDELPQLFSVLKGDMSLVGPRPERPYFVKKLRAELPLYGLREAVKPGVTGWAQISYPYGATVEDAKAKLEYDLYYIQHRSPFLVLLVLAHTARTVLTGKGAR